MAPFDALPSLLAGVRGRDYTAPVRELCGQCAACSTRGDSHDVESLCCDPGVMRPPEPEPPATALDEDISF